MKVLKLTFHSYETFAAEIKGWNKYARLFLNETSMCKLRTLVTFESTLGLIFYFLKFFMNTQPMQLPGKRIEKINKALVIRYMQQHCALNTQVEMIQWWILKDSNIQYRDINGAVTCVVS